MSQNSTKFPMSRNKRNSCMLDFEKRQTFFFSIVGLAFLLASSFRLGFFGYSFGLFEEKN